MPRKYGRNSTDYGRWEQANRPSMDREGVERWDSWYFIAKGQPLIAIGRAGPEGPWGTVPASAKPAGGWSMFFFRVPDSGKGLGRTWMSLGLGGDMTSFGTPSGPVPKTLAEAKKLAMEYAGGVDPTKGGPETKRWIALRPPSWERMWWEKWGKARAKAKAREKAKNVGPGFDIVGLALEKARAKAKKNGPKRDRPRRRRATKARRNGDYSQTSDDELVEIYTGEKAGNREEALVEIKKRGVLDDYAIELSLEDAAQQHLYDMEFERDITETLETGTPEEKRNLREWLRDPGGTSAWGEETL